MDAIIKYYTDRYNNIQRLFDEDKLDECLEAAQDFIETDCPRYHRIKTLVC